VTRFVIDASVAVKWVVAEPDSDLAVAVLESFLLSAPDLLFLKRLVQAFPLGEIRLRPALCKEVR